MILGENMHFYMFLVCNYIIYGVLKLARSRCGRDHMVVGITTTYAINAYHH